MLLQWVIAEIDSLDWSNPELVQILRASPKFRPRFLLVLMTYAYSLGVYESEELVDLFYSDSTLRQIFPDDDPTRKAIVRFRADQRGLLRWALTQVFKQALRHHFQLADAVIPAGLRKSLVLSATIRIDAARHLDRSKEGE